MKSFSDEKITTAKNTYGSGIGVNYTWVARSSLLVSAGIEGVFQKYVLETNYPFQDFYFAPPTRDGDKYRINQNVYCASLHLALGYRFEQTKVLTPEVRLGHTFQMPLNSVRLNYTSYELYNADQESENFSRTGNLGRYSEAGNTKAVEMITSIYLGVHIRSGNYILDRLSLGMQAQRKLFYTDNPFNRLKISYKDASGNQRGYEEFNGRHTAVSVLIGYRL